MPLEDEDDDAFDQSSWDGVRQTSKAAWEAINSSGLLSYRHLLAYNIVYEHGPMTANQVGEVAKKQYADRTVRHNYNSRCGELRDHKLLRELWEGACPVTGFDAIFYDVTDVIPTQPIRRLAPSAVRLLLPVPVAQAAIEEIYRLTAAGMIIRGELVQIAVQLGAKVKYAP